MHAEVDHVVVLALENRSFDHVLGCLQQVYPALDGVNPVPPRRSNSYQGTSFSQTPDAARFVCKDPKHELRNVLQQLANANSGFVEDFAVEYGQSTTDERAEVMKYHDLGSLPALHTLAKNFMVCDHWFASVPGPTWTNRLFLMSGTSLGRVRMPEGIMSLNLHWYDQSTVFDRLNERKIPWKVYFGDVPLSLLLVHQWLPENARRHCAMTEFFKDAAGPEPSFPSFAFIEPAYLPPNAADAHPPHDILAADALVGSVYKALRSNDHLWRKTLLIVLFDEHGGFYDHVPPPNAVPPDHHHDEYAFDRLGVRVPALLISPWVERGVFTDTLDHTSVLKFVQTKWQLGDLGYRTHMANSFEAAFSDGLREHTPATVFSIGGPPTSSPCPGRVHVLTSNQNALVALSHVLETLSDEDATVVAARARHLLTSAQSQVDVAFDRVEAFLLHAHRSNRTPP